MLCSVRWMYSTRVVSIHGPAMASTTTAATTLGTNDSVASLICVAACSTLTTRPTTSTVISSGAATISISIRPCWPSVKTCWESIGQCGELRDERCGQRAQQQVPPVGQHEQHQLERQRD